MADVDYASNAKANTGVTLGSIGASALTSRVDAITSEIVPICKVCPQPMQRFNTWATPTAQSPDCVSCSAAQGASAQ